MNYLFLAYGIAWGLVFAYAAWLACRQSALEKRLAALERGAETEK